MPEPVKALNRKRGRKKKLIEREHLSPSDALLVSSYGDDIDIASVKRALLWLSDIQRPGLSGERALKLLQQAEDAYRGADFGFFHALEKITRKKICQAEVVRLFLTGQHKTLSAMFNESLASPVEAQLIRSFKVWSEDQPTFHEVKDKLLKAGLKIEDKSLRRACKRVGLDLKPSRGWRGEGA